MKPNWNGANIESELRGILAECCRRDLSQVGDDADLVRELGLDSLAMLRLLAEVAVAEIAAEDGACRWAGAGSQP